MTPKAFWETGNLSHTLFGVLKSVSDSRHKRLVLN